MWPGLSIFAQENFNSGLIDISEMKQRFLCIQAVEAARTIAEGVVMDPREADVGSILGFGFAPFTGGAISYIDGMGIKNFVVLCDRLAIKYGPRFTPRNYYERWLRIIKHSIQRLILSSPLKRTFSSNSSLIDEFLICEKL